MRAVPNALQTYSPPRSNGSVDSNTSWNGVVPADPTIVAVVKSATPRADRDRSPPIDRQAPAEDDAGTQERQPRQQRMRPVDRHVEDVAADRVRPRLGQPTHVVTPVLLVERPPAERPTGERGGETDGDDPPGAQREDGRGDDEHRAVVGDDGARPDDVEEQTGDVQEQPAPNESPAHRHDALVVAGGRPGEQRHADTGDEDERGREPGRQRAGPRVEEFGRPSAADTLAIAIVEHEVAVEVHHDDTDQRERADHVGAGQPSPHDVADRWQGAFGQSHANSSTSVMVSGRCTSTRSPIAGPVCPAGTKHIETCMWGGSCRRQAGPIEVERAPAVGERGDTVGAAGADHHEVTVAGHLAEVIARPLAAMHGAPLEDLGRQVQRALVAVPQRRPEAVAVRVCRRAATRTPARRDG